MRLFPLLVTLGFWALFLGVLPVASAQMVRDDFADGDFTQSPPWTGDTERFTVVPFDGGFALRSDGLARPDTIHLATGSTVASGRWRFLFRHEANLSNANGARVYLVASSPDLKGAVQGYYVQFGTNNLNRIELWRQDGLPTDRQRLAVSEPLVAGDANTVRIEVTRDARDAWTVWANDEVIISGVTDRTHIQSEALGVWVKHSTANGAAFFFDDFLADPDPGDITPPEPLAVTAAEGGAVLLVAFSEPLDPATVTPDAFAVSGGADTPASAAMDDTPDMVRLAFDAPLPEGSYTLNVAGVADLVGNVQPGAEIAFTVAIDTDPPNLTAAEAISPTLIRVTFDEPVRGCDAALYEVTPEVGPPLAIACPSATTYELTLAASLTGPRLYTVTAYDVADFAGNVRRETSAQFFWGTFDTPEPGDVVVNEIMYREAEGGTEYIELRNTTEGVFDLSAFTISDQGTPRPITNTPFPFGPGVYLAVARDVAALRARHGSEGGAFEMPRLPNLNNTGDVVVLRVDGTVIDSVFYRPGWHRPELRDDRGVALERLDASLSSNAPGNWTSSLDPSGGTPGRPNSASLPPGEGPAAAGLEVSPSPFDAASGTVIRYRLAAEAGVVRVRVFDGAGRLVRTLEDAALGGNASTGEVIWDGRDDRNDSLRVGIYVVLLEALDLAGGTTEAYRTPVVLARSQ